jgi:anti-sigma B factor antagonist
MFQEGSRIGFCLQENRMNEETRSGKNIFGDLADLSSAVKSPAPAKTLEIQVRHPASGVITVALAGSLDTVTAPDLERELSPVLAGGGKDLVFDLARLRFISSAGLRVFSMVRKQLKVRGGQASFINMQPQIHEVFEIIKALPGVAVFKNVAEFDSYLAAQQRAHETKK